MINVAKALNSFWKSFGIPAYIEDTLPSDVHIPYITYTLTQPGWQESASIQARVWYKGTNYNAVMAKVDEIANTIGEGFSIPTEDGNVVLYKDVNFSQIQPFPDSDLRVVYLNLIINAHTN